MRAEDVTHAACEEASSGPAAPPPLVVDLDGTLVATDIQLESLFALAVSRPFAALRTAGALVGGRAALKQSLARNVTIDVGALPFNAALLRLLADERARGRPIYLATAADRRPATAIADHLGLFDGVFASDGSINLKGSAKADALCRAFGEHGFGYAGNETADFPVWEKAGDIVVVDASPSVRRAVARRWPGATILGGSGDRRDYLRALRPHQWLKNLLVLLPAFAAHRFGLAAFLTALLAFFSFSLCASSAYVLNDLIDLRSDRAHPSKRSRPLARGAVPLMHGAMMVPLLLLAAVIPAVALPASFLAVLAAYYGLTLAYSFVLKRQIMLDVVTLACLYGMRLVAGGVAVSVFLSSWLAAFSIFIFCSLALVKRCTELVGRPTAGEERLSGRAYRAVDLPVLEGLAAASGVTAVLVFALYINSDAVVRLYHHPRRLWLLCIVLIYWVGRILILTRRGDVHDDPVVFTVTDPPSLLCAGLGLAIVLASL